MQPDRIFSISCAAWQGGCGSCSCLPCTGLAGQGILLGLGGMLGAWGDGVSHFVREHLSCTLRGSVPQVQPRIGGTGRYAHCICPVSTLYQACPGLGRRMTGRLACCRVPRGAHHNPPRLPSRMQLRKLQPQQPAREGSGQSDGLPHLHPGCLCSLLCCLTPRSLHCPVQPWLLSPASPAPQSHSGDQGRGLAPSLALIHLCIELPGRRHEGPRPGSPFASLHCCSPSEPTLTM